MQMAQPEPGQCACAAEWATVRLSTEHGVVLIGTRCAAVIENVLRLQGVTPKRGAALSVVQP